MRIRAVHVHFGVKREGDVVLGRAEVADRGLGAGLLVTELVARKAQHCQPVVAQRPVEFFQARVLRCEAALGGAVHHQQHAAAVDVQGLVLPVDGAGREIEDIAHAGSCVRRLDARAPVRWLARRV
ncbi:hypothetical protein G6F59_016437 [Rhizopus arrhizus]|nr:hypothetical protein G6F59_016437 [Rhizopus arrhizus]